MRPVQVQAARLDGLAHEVEGHEVLQALGDHRVFEAGEVALLLLAVAGGVERLHRRLDQGDPAADEVARGERIGAEPGGLDAAAGGVAQHDDVLHLEGLHRELDRRGGAVIAAVVLGRRHDVGHVADGEDLAGARIEDHLGRDAAVAAADQQHVRILALVAQRLVLAPLVRQPLAEEAAVAFGQNLRKHRRLS